jgi:hypothetical protein
MYAWTASQSKTKYEKNLLYWNFAISTGIVGTRHQCDSALSEYLEMKNFLKEIRNHANWVYQGPAGNDFGKEKKLSK